MLHLPPRDLDRLRGGGTPLHQTSLVVAPRRKVRCNEASSSASVVGDRRDNARPSFAVSRWYHGRVVDGGGVITLTHGPGRRVLPLLPRARAAGSSDGDRASQPQRCARIVLVVAFRTQPMISGGPASCGPTLARHRAPSSIARRPCRSAQQRYVIACDREEDSHARSPRF